MAATLLQQNLNQAVRFLQSGKPKDAIAPASMARRLQPRNFDGWFLGGVAALQCQPALEAVELLGQAVQLNPTHAVASLRYASALMAAGRAEAAEEHLAGQVERLGKLGEYWSILGESYEALGRREQAVEAARRWVALCPNDALGHETLAERLVKLEGMVAAEPHFRRALALDPKLTRGWSNLGIACAEQGKIAESFGCFARARALDPRWRFSYSGRALALLRSYRMQDAADEYAALLAVLPADLEAASNRLMTLNYLEQESPSSLAAAHFEYGARFSQPGPAPIHAHERLRVGFVSPDFRTHSCAWFVEPVFRHLDRSQFEIFLYHNHRTVDGVSTRLQALADSWKHVAGLSSAQLLALIRRDEIDLLVDLAGHTSHNSLPVFAQRAAPVQINYLGYPNTTGLREIDYRLVDPVTDPTAADDALHSEKLIRFSPTAWAYQPPPHAPACSIPPSLSGRPVTFGTFNNFAKVTDTCLREWSRLLEAVPGSQLVLKSPGLERAEVAGEVLRRVSAAGIAPERVTLRDRMASEVEHLALYQSIDIALDTAPYNGTTTTCEALWMGVPVVTLRGDRHAGRVGASLLQAVGHPEWIAANWADYHAIAVGLAGSGDTLLAIRQNLRAEMTSSLLLDHHGQATRLGQTLVNLWNERGQASG